MHYEISYKRQAIIAAKELGYGTEIVDKIKSSENDSEINQIMIAAREARFGKSKKTINKEVG